MRLCEQLRAISEQRVAVTPQQYGDIFVRRPEANIITVRDSDVQVGRVEFGFHGDPADAIIVVSAGGLSGGGPATQTLQAAECAKLIANDCDPPPHIGFVGPSSELPYFADNLTGQPPEMIAFIETADTVPKKFQTVTEGLTNATKILKESGRKRIVFLSNGYTAFIPYGVQRAMENIDAKGSGIRGKVLIFDSSYPDSSNPLVNLDGGNGYPVDRFYPPAYTSSPDGTVDVYMALANWVPVNIKWRRERAPAGAVCIATTLPFSTEYVRKWMEFRLVPMEEARKTVAEIEGVSPKFAQALLNPNTIFIPLYASGGYWDEGNVGKWMTRIQYVDMMKGTRTIVHSADFLARTTNRPVVLAGCKPFVDLAKTYAQKDRIAHWSDIEDSNPGNITPGLYLATAPMIKQSSYGFYMRAGNAGIFRSVQTNTMGEAVCAGVPAVVVSMPGHGYMDALYMDQELYTRAGRVYKPDASPLVIADRLQSIVQDPGEAESLAQRQLTIFQDLYVNTGACFPTVLSHICGIPYWA